MTANPLLFIAVSLTLGVILVNGWTDAPNAIATCVVTRCMPPKAASYLVECLENYDLVKIEKMIEEMHVFEHGADMKKHEMNEALAKAFVTPVDR